MLQPEKSLNAGALFAERVEARGLTSAVATKITLTLLFPWARILRSITI